MAGYLGNSMSGAIGYVRTSTVEQANTNNSIPVQTSKFQNFCVNSSLPQLKVFVDKQSARTADERPQFQEMLAYCRKNHKKISCVVVSDLSRFARNVADQGASIAELKRLGINTISVDEPMVDSTSAGKLAANMLGAFNQYFSDSLSEKTKFRMQAAVKAGRFVWRAPIGYILPKTGSDSTVKVDPERAPLVRKGFELIASGNHHVDEVLRTITALGLRTVRGAVLPRQTWHAALRNPLYAGWVKSGDLLVHGIHAPIVTQELFDAVQDVLVGRSKTKQTRQVMNPEFPLRQFIRCAKCDKGLTAGIAKKKFPYYWCYRKGCRAVFVPAAQLEEAFVGWIGQYEPTVEYLALLPDLAREVWAKRQERAKQDSRALNIRLQEQKHLNSQAIKAKLKGELSEEDFADLKQSITEETASIQNALTALESVRSTMEELIAQTQRELIDLPAAWKKAGLQGRREFCELLFPKGLVWGHEWGFLNSKNTSIMQDLCDFWADKTSGVKDGGPTRI
jgi:site-specific DNA recombinase